MEIILEKSKDGHSILKVLKEGKEKFIGSKYNQERECEKFIKEFKIDGWGYTYIVIGLASVEVIKKLEENLSSERILILEFNKKILEVYKEALLKRRLGINTKIIKSELQLEKELENVNVEKLKTLCFGNYNKVFNIETIEMFNGLKTYVEKRIIDRNTKIHFGDMWTENDLNNSKYIHVSKKINELKRKYLNKPCILVAAGPSLSKNIKEIDKEKAYIISGGRTLKALKNIKVDPDFLVVTDGGEISYGLVEADIENTNSKLVYTETTNYKIVEKHKGEKIVAAKYGFMKKALGDIENISVGGSVANSMAYVAAYLGFNPIIFVGQDLAYTEEKGHADIAGTYNRSVEGRDGYFKENDLYVDDIYGKKVRTSIEFMQFLSSMEKIIEGFPNTRFIDATEGGAKIKGTEIKRLRVIMENLEKINKKEKIIIEENLKIKKRINEEIEKQSKNLKKIVVEAKKGKELIERLEEKVNSGVLAELDKIDNIIKMNIKNTDVLEHKLFKILNNLENNEKYQLCRSDSNNMKINKNLMKNREFYDELIKSSTEILELLKKN
ncbi:MAG: motility associated factor glycosyltransferase family protein [Clostridium sp.]